MTFALRIYESDSEESEYQQQRLQADTTAEAVTEAHRLAKGRPFTVELYPDRKE